MKERIAVILAFILIFAFSSIDSAISPMVKQIAESYKTHMAFVLHFISVCTFGTVIGVFIGPWIVTKQKPVTLLFTVSFLLFAAQVGFLVAYNINLGLTSRFLSGFCTGIIASIMWWMTYHGVSQKYYHAMIAVLMSARPLSTAIGVPFMGLIAWKYIWQVPYWWLTALMFISAILLVHLLPGKTIEDTTVTNIGLINVYKRVFSIPYTIEFYTGFTINRMCYFGFYAIAGIWFIEHYGLDLKKMSFSLLVIGLAEALVNFNTGQIIKRFGHKLTFNCSIILSFLLFVVFIWGKINLGIAIAFIAAFMLLDRVYSMALIIEIPRMFPSTGDKTAFGSLNTLTAWLGLSLISAIASKILPKYGLFGVELLLLITFTVGTATLYHVQFKTLYSKVKSSL